MNKIKFVCVMLLIIAFAISCDNDSRSTALLQQATEVIEENPKLALVLLDSIQSPETMDKNSYMKYIVANTQARFKNYIDVTGDTLIFEAEKYFHDRFDHNQAALAHYYAANVLIDRGNKRDGLTSLFNAEHRAKLADNKLLIAKSQHSIGNSYFARNMDTLSIQYYQNALEHYDVLENTNTFRLQLFNLLGRANQKINRVDSADYYYTQGLNLSLEENNKYYQMQFLQHLGVVEWRNRNFNYAITNLNKALALATNKSDSTRVFLNLAIVYNSKQQSDSAKYYTDFVVDGLPLVKDERVLRAMYGALADYNTQIGNDAEAKRYSELWHAKDKEILKANSVVELLKAKQNFLLSIQQKEAEQKSFITIVSISVAAFILLVILLFLYIRLRFRMQLETEKNKILEAKSETQEAKLNAIFALKVMSNNTAKEWNEIDEEVKELANELGASEKPVLYQKIEQMIANLETKSQEQRIKWAKEYLDQFPYEERLLRLFFTAEMQKKLTKKLRKTQQHLLVLCCCGYSKAQIASVLNIEERNVFPRKLDLKHLLTELGFAFTKIEQILFST